MQCMCVENEKSFFRIKFLYGTPKLTKHKRLFVVFVELVIVRLAPRQSLYKYDGIEWSTSVLTDFSWYNIPKREKYTK
jgi:hypothetical protein